MNRNHPAQDLLTRLPFPANSRLPPEGNVIRDENEAAIRFMGAARQRVGRDGASPNSVAVREAALKMIVAGFATRRADTAETDSYGCEIIPMTDFHTGSSGPAVTAASATMT